MKLSFLEILTLMIGSVDTISGKELSKNCLKLKMNSVEYINLGLDSTLPPFDRGYNHVFTTEHNEEALFEILERNNQILQVGFQIIYKGSLLLSKIKKDYSRLALLLDDYYGNSISTKLENLELKEYASHTTLAYISKTKANSKDVLNLRIGNKKLWFN